MSSKNETDVYNNYKLLCREFIVPSHVDTIEIVYKGMFSFQMGVANRHTFDELKSFVDKMLLTENHDPEKFMKKKKALPVARISEETFETFLEKDLVFINYFAPW